MNNKIVVPGEIIANETNGYMAGWGTFSDQGFIRSSVAGTVQTVDKLINVTMINYPYKPEQGDVIIGRIVSVEKKQWRVNINSNREALLNLVNINLPQGEQRRRSEEDTYVMKSFFAENDLLSGEVLSVHSDGGATIQTRNLKYGKLKDGCLIKVNSNLIRKMRVHFIDICNGIKLILGKNGMIWIYYSSIKLKDDYFTDDQNKLNQTSKEEEINKEACLLIILMRNIILRFDEYKIQIDKPSLIYYFDKYCSINSLYLGNSNQIGEKLLLSLENYNKDLTQKNNEILTLSFDIKKLNECLVINDKVNIAILSELKDVLVSKKIFSLEKMNLIINEEKDDIDEMDI